MTRRAFTLVEVVVALVVLEVGLLGVVGTLLVAARDVRRAVLLERVVTGAARVYDSVASAPTAGGGTRVDARGRWTWSLAADGSFRLQVVAPGDTVLFTLRGRALPAGPP